MYNISLHPFKIEANKGMKRNKTTFEKGVKKAPAACRKKGTPNKEYSGSERNIRTCYVRIKWNIRRRCKSS